MKNWERIRARLLVVAIVEQLIRGGSWPGETFATFDTLGKSQLLIDVE